MEKEKYYIMINSPKLFYKSTNEQLASIDTCCQIVDKTIIDWLNNQKFKKCRKYNAECLDDPTVFPFNIKFIKQEERYVVVKKN